MCPLGACDDDDGRTKKTKGEEEQEQEEEEQEEEQTESMQEERKSNASCIITDYETKAGVKTNDLGQIKEDVFNFYNNLLGIDRISDGKDGI